MTDRTADIFLLAPDADLRRRIAEHLPSARPAPSVLDALADMAASGRPATLVTTPTALGYRHEQILATLRRELPEARVCIVATPDEEPRAMKLAADAATTGDYFLAPYGLRDLAASLQDEPDAAGPSTAPLGDEVADVLHGPIGEHPPDELRAALQQIACMTGQRAEAVARTAVETVAAVAGVCAAAVLVDHGAVAPLASVGEPVDWSIAAQALRDPTLVANQWLPLGDHLWLFAAAGTQEPGPALAVRGREPGLSATALEDLAAMARVALSLVAAARVREAAVRILSTDAETGLASRRYLDHYLTLAVRRAAESRREITLALVSPSGNSLLSRSTLQALVELLKHDFAPTPSGEATATVKLARADADTLAVVFAGTAEGQAPPVERLAAFAQRVAEAALPVPVAIASAGYPWHAGDARTLMAAARNRLAKSRDSGLPIIE